MLKLKYYQSIRLKKIKISVYCFFFIWVNECKNNKIKNYRNWTWKTMNWQRVTIVYKLYNRNLNYGVKIGVKTSRTLRRAARATSLRKRHLEQTKCVAINLFNQTLKCVCVVCGFVVDIFDFLMASFLQKIIFTTSTTLL